MFTEEEVLAKIAETYKLRAEKQGNKSVAELPTWLQGKVSLPNYYTGYLEAVSNFEHIRVHGEKGVFPEHLFVKAAPNQEEEEFNYAKENYKQTTLPVFTDFINTINRSFTDPAAGVTYATEGESNAVTASGQTFEKYVTEEKIFSL